MKKFFLFLIMLATVSVATAQGNFEALKVKLNKSNEELSNPSKAAKASTWLKNAEIYLSIANLHTEGFFAQMPASQLVMLIGRPINAGAPPIVSINGEDFTKYEYQSVDAYFDSKNLLRFFVETKSEMPDALENAVKSANKALDLDPNIKPKVVDFLNRVVKAYALRADNNFNINNLEGAASSYVNAGILGSAELVNYPDSYELLYYGIASFVSSNKFADAKKAIDILVDKNYLKDGYVLYYKGVVEDRLGNKAEAEKALLKGVQEYPTNDRILNTLIAYYVQNNEDPNKVIPYIKKAQEHDPNNVVLFIAEGLAYDSMKDSEKAVAAYQIALKMNPENFDVAYNLGLAQYRISEKIAKDLASIDFSKTDEYASKQAEIDVAQMSALDALLKAHSIDPKETNTIELIRSIYFRQRNKSPEMMAKYEEFQKKSEELKK